MPFEPSDVDAVVSSVLVINGNHDVGTPCLHPFCHDNPCFFGRDVDDAEIPQACSSFWYENLFGRSDNVQFLRIDLSNEQRSAMTKDMVVVRALACVDEKQAVGMSDPVLLRVVIAQIAAVIECPAPGRVVVQSVAAGRDVAVIVVAKSQIKTIAEPRN